MNTQGVDFDVRPGKKSPGPASRWALIIAMFMLVVLVGILTALAVLDVRARARGPLPAPAITPTPVPNPSIQLSPEEGEPGELITVTGRDWRQGDTVFVRLDGISLGSQTPEPLAFAVVRPEGHFTTSFVFPSDGPWTSLPYVLVSVRSPATGDEVLARLRVSGSAQALLPTPAVTVTLTPTQPVSTPEPASPGPLPATGCVDRASFVSDVTVPDNTYLSPGQSFVKTWRLQNSGTCTWTADYALVFAGGHSMGGLSSVPLQHPVPPDSTVDLSVSLTAPAGNGAYEGKWQLRDASGNFFGTGDRPAGSSFWVRIIVGQVPSSLLGTANWRGEYYDNPDLRGQPALVRDDADVNFAWGWDAPAAGLPADNFSMRWTCTAEFDGTTYRFHAWADDGIRLWVDDRLILDAWWDGGLRERTMDYVPSRGAHALRVEFYDRTGDARVHVWWEKVAVPSYPDWRAEYWSNRGLSGEPALVRNDPHINFNWGLAAPAVDLPADNFSIRWTRTAGFDAATYRFHIWVDDGARLWMDDRLIIDTWDGGSAREVTADQDLRQGIHHLRVDFYEYTGEARIHVWWEKISSS